MAMEDFGEFQTVDDRSLLMSTTFGGFNIYKFVFIVVTGFESRSI